MPKAKINSPVTSAVRKSITIWWSLNNSSLALHACWGKYIYHTIGCLKVIHIPKILSWTAHAYCRIVSWSRQLMIDNWSIYFYFLFELSSRDICVTIWATGCVLSPLFLSNESQQKPSVRSGAPFHYNVWFENTYPFINFNGATFEVCKWISNFIPHFIEHVITCHVSERGAGCEMRLEPWGYIYIPCFFTFWGSTLWNQTCDKIHTLSFWIIQRYPIPPASSIRILTAFSVSASYC